MNHMQRQCRVVTQPGIVTDLHGTEADIQIVQTSACSSCRIRGVCAPGEASAKIIRVSDARGLTEGMPVTVRMRESYGWLGVLVAFVLPLAIVVGVLFSLAGVLGSQEASALVGLAALVPYYGLLYATRHWFAAFVRFEAVPRNAADAADAARPWDGVNGAEAAGAAGAAGAADAVSYAGAAGAAGVRMTVVNPPLLYREGVE